MAALLQIHSHYRVAGVEQRKEYGEVCRRSAVRLNVCVLGAEKLFRALSRYILNNIDAAAAAVIALAGITLGVLVRKNVARR